MPNTALKDNWALPGDENILSTLEGLYHESRYLLMKSTVTPTDAQKLSGYVTNVSMLLTELEQLENRMRRSENALAAIHALKQRYGELEGMVKEAGNRPPGRTSAGAA